MPNKSVEFATWSHLDDEQEIAEFATKSGQPPNHKTSSSISASSTHSQKELDEQKKRTKYLEPVVQSKDEAIKTLSARYSKLDSAMQTIDRDRKSGKLKRLSAAEIVALRNYEAIQSANTLLSRELRKRNAELRASKEIKERLQRLEGDEERLSTMDADALKALKSEMQNNIKKVELAIGKRVSQWTVNEIVHNDHVHKDTGNCHRLLCIIEP